MPSKVCFSCCFARKSIASGRSTLCASVLLAGTRSSLVQAQHLWSKCRARRAGVFPHAMQSWPLLRQHARQRRWPACMDSLQGVQQRTTPVQSCSEHVAKRGMSCASCSWQYAQGAWVAADASPAHVRQSPLARCASSVQRAHHVASRELHCVHIGAAGSLFNSWQPPCSD